MQSLIELFSRVGGADRSFRLGKLGASIATAALVCVASLAVANSDALVVPRLEGQRLSIEALLSAMVLLVAGTALRVRRSHNPMGAQRTLCAGVMHGVTREAEIATGFIASVLAGVAVAGNEPASNAIGGWVVNALGASSSITAMVTIALVAAIGTVLTDLARGEIARAILESSATRR